jgi:hypothetical protein
MMPMSASRAASKGLVWDGVVTDQSAQPLFIDTVHRRLYLSEYFPGEVEGGGDDFSIAEYDLDAPYGQMLVRRKSWASMVKATYPPSDNKIAADIPNGRAFFFDGESALAEGLKCHCSLIRVLDLHSFTVTSEWDLDQMVPGFYAQGITYSQADHRVYAIGSINGRLVDAANIASVPFVPAVMLAIDVDTGTLAWARSLPKCLRTMTNSGTGTYIVRSRHFPALYVGCARLEAALNSAPYPGASGVLRLWIDPAADTAKALAFKEEFFRVAGSFRGIAAPASKVVFDYAAERLMLSSSSEATPGFWIFDGLASSWAGFVPVPRTQTGAVGVDEATGRMYVRAPRGSSAHRTPPGLIVTDGRGSPVLPGEVFQISRRGASYEPTDASTFFTDPITHRIFVRVFNPTASSGDKVSFIAMRDETSLVPPDDRTYEQTYDSRTADVPEGPDTLATFSGSTAGFGVRALLVGGTGGLTSPVRTGQVLAAEFWELVVGDGIPPGDRGLWGARVPLVDLRTIGASAEAQAARPDDLTRDQQGSTRPTLEQNGAPGTATAAMDWPWPDSFCSDSTGRPVSDHYDRNGGDVAIACDLDRRTASARAGFGGFRGEGVTIGSAGFDGSSVRDTAGGVRTDSRASVHGVEIAVPGAGTLRIGEISQHVIAHAAGRPGTAHLDWEPAVKDVHVLDASGKDVFSCASSCDPHEVAGVVNDRFDLFMRMRIPTPERVATPGGAFAGFQESRDEYVGDLVMDNDGSRAVPAVHVEIYNDWSEKSRLVLDFAAIESSAIYQISKADEPMDEPAAPEGDPPTAVTPALPGGPSIAQQVVPQPGAPIFAAPPSAGFVPRIVQAALFLVRSPGQFASMVLLWMLLGLAGALLARRNALAKTLSSSLGRSPAS